MPMMSTHEVKTEKITVTTILTIQIAILERNVSFNGATRGLLPKSWRNILFITEAIIEFVSESVKNGSSSNFHLERSLNFPS